MYSQRIDMTGQRFGRLVVLTVAGYNNDKRVTWNCLCDCGGTVIVSGKYLRSGRTGSCGCLRRERASLLNAKHGMHGTSTWQSWISMRNRCYNKNQKGYADYGAKGVVVCERWRNSFVDFIVDMGKRPEGMTLDRINPFGNYEPSNCRWATPLMQSNNRRRQTKAKSMIRLLIAESRINHAA